MNTINLIGRVANDLEITQGKEIKIAKFRLAVQRQVKKDSSQQDVDFIPCSALGNTAEFLEKYISKGQQIGVVGKLRINRYEKDGQIKTATEVVINEVYFAGNKLEEKGE